MAAEKCNYLVLSKSKANFSNKMNLKLFNQRLSHSDNICFLGIRFDHCLSFKNQVEFLKSTCQNRLNCLKILAHKSWNLTKDTLKQVYFALVRSVIEYSSLVLPKICKSSFLKIQIIQNCAIKVIHKLLFREHTVLVHKISGIERLESRFRKLN
jgi:hypothetical protein